MPLDCLRSSGDRAAVFNKWSLLGGNQHCPRSLAGVLKMNLRSGAGYIGEPRPLMRENAEQTLGMGMRRDCTPATCDGEDTVQPASRVWWLWKHNAGC